MPWINVRDSLPKDGQEVYYFSPILGLWRGKYTYSPFTHTTWYDENNQPHTEPASDSLRLAVSPHVFYCESGNCDTDEVTHWQPYDADHAARGWIPLPPNHGISPGRIDEYREWREEIIFKGCDASEKNADESLSAPVTHAPEWLAADEVLVDPPSGWLYGFPKVWNRKTHPDMPAWLIENGYPEKDAKTKGLTYRFMSVPKAETV